jgi:hypothetical protein
MPGAHTSAEIFLHIRVVMGVILGLGIARLLGGIARFIQHPGRHKVYFVHMGWVVSILLTLVHFWWWEFWLFDIERWSFAIYAFLLAYLTVLYLLSTLLFPDDIAEYRDYEDYFMSRRKWFFGLLAATFLLDLVDTLIKGAQHLQLFGNEYAIRVPAYVTLCLVAMAWRNKCFHIAFVVASLVYQVSWIVRLFGTLE